MFHDVPTCVHSRRFEPGSARDNPKSHLTRHVYAKGSPHQVEASQGLPEAPQHFSQSSHFFKQGPAHPVPDKQAGLTVNASEWTGYLLPLGGFMLRIQSHAKPASLLILTPHFCQMAIQRLPSNALKPMDDAESSTQRPRGGGGCVMFVPSGLRWPPHASKPVPKASDSSGA